MYDVIIIGAGPAGLTAALYASRAELSVLILDKDAPGGKLLKTAEVENYPGTKSITGPDMAMQWFEHATAFGATFDYGNVLDIVDLGKTKKVITDVAEYDTYAVIIATGTKERLIGVPGEDSLYGRGVSYCAVCDGAFFKGKNMAVIGGGNSALEEALFLSKLANKVYLVHRRTGFRAEPGIVKHVQATPNIEMKLEYLPVSINGQEKVESLTIKNVHTNQEEVLDVAAVFPFIGADPESRFATRLGITNDQGYIVVNEKMETKIPGIYGAGDVNNKILRQIVTAGNDGSIAAIEISHYVDRMKAED